MIKSIENFRQFLISALLRKNCSIINTFPMGFVVNTGSHKSGGIHWQGIYFDHNHRVYFFDSYGRKPMEHYMLYTELMFTFSYMRRYNRRLPIGAVLYEQNFTQELYDMCNKRHLNDVTNITYNYYNRQLQSPLTNVCGEYSIMFLYVICRHTNPEECA